MYDFSKQKIMLEVTLELLKENSLLEISSLGGGTALAGYYWNHRQSTEIDIFIYGNENKTQLLKPSDWSENIKSKMDSIGFNGNFRHNNIYTEIVIDKDSKIQFFDVVKKSKEPFCKANLWDKDIQIDTIEEIIAMKIDVIQRGGRKKDYWDLHNLLDSYSISQMIELHEQRYPYSHDKDLIIQNFISFEQADDDFDPICYKGKYWEFIKEDFEEIIKNNFR